MDTKFARERYSESIDFGPCIVGRNLNVLCVRGHGRLDELAAISAPDIYDMVENPRGTQRELSTQHARECLAYAVDAVGMPPEEDPCFFPDILLNARDVGVIELYDLEDPNRLIDLDSTMDLEEVEAPFVGVRVKIADIEFPKKTRGPQISRVDGNHRLYGVDELLDKVSESGDENENGDRYPSVAFSLLLNLNPDQEAKLFRDINGEHKGMETAHLTQLVARLADPEKLKQDPKLRALWLATELAKPGRAFEGMVFMGGSRVGVRKTGFIPPVKINSLKSTIHEQLRSAPTANAVLKNNPDALLNLVDNFWKAIKKRFPDAWNNKRDFILLQAIGLGAFARFGGWVMERAIEDVAVDQEDLEKYLQPVAANVSLKREDYPGIAGAGGALTVAEKLIEAASSEAVKTAQIIKKLQPDPSIDDKLGS